MTVVIDASALVAALVDSGSEGDWADEVTASGPLLAPELILVETANTLRRLEESGAITRLEATSAFRDLMHLIPPTRSRHTRAPGGSTEATTRSLTALPRRLTVVRRLAWTAAPNHARRPASAAGRAAGEFDGGRGPSDPQGSHMRVGI